MKKERKKERKGTHQGHDFGDVVGRRSVESGAGLALEDGPLAGEDGQRAVQRRERVLRRQHEQGALDVLDAVRSAHVQDAVVAQADQQRDRLGIRSMRFTCKCVDLVCCFSVVRFSEPRNDLDFWKKNYDFLSDAQGVHGRIAVRVDEGAPQEPLELNQPRRRFPGGGYRHSVVFCVCVCVCENSPQNSPVFLSFRNDHQSLLFSIKCTDLISESNSLPPSDRKMMCKLI